MENKKCYSTNNEDFQYNEMDDAIRDVFDDPDMTVGTITTIYEGDAIPWKAGDFAPSDVIDTLNCGGLDNAGEWAEDWPECTKEQEKDLDQRIKDVINQWADDHGLQPNFYGVHNVKEIQVELTAEDGDYKILGTKHE